MTEELAAPRLTRAVRWIVAINVAIAFLDWVLLDLVKPLGFSSPEFSRTPWTVFTHMFVHGTWWHLALTTTAAYLFGRRLEQSWSAWEFVRFYALCGLGGWFFHLLVGKETLLIGSTAAVLGVLLAYGMRWPDDEASIVGLIAIKTKWLLALFAAACLVTGAISAPEGTRAAVSYLGPLGGIAAAWIYLRSVSGAGIDRLRQRVSPIPDLPDETPRAIPRSLPRSRDRGKDIDEIVARSNAVRGERALPSPPVATKPPQRLTDLNAMLDKISQQGLESLTSEERRLLDELSRELRRPSSDE